MNIIHKQEGKLIQTFQLKDKIGQRVWNTMDIPDGMYFYTFTVDGISKSGKVVISK